MIFFFVFFFFKQKTAYERRISDWSSDVCSSDLHLGRCAPVDGDDICNGAVDNTTGVAGLVTLAQAYKAAGAPDRSIVFLAVTAEESGLPGSQYYAANPVFPLAQTVGGVNLDALNAAGPGQATGVVGGDKSGLAA